MLTAVAQLSQMPAFLRDLLTSELAYVALLGIFVLEGAMLMYIMPSEAIVPGSVLLIGGTLAENAAIIAVAVLGATIGQYLLFVLAKRGGREYLLDKRWFRVSEARLDRFDRWFDRWGPLVVPVSNSLPFTRGMLTVPAGFAKMRDRDFIVLSALGTLVFETLLAAAAIGLLEAL
jgi:membrane protein DedA with SNARE-associated domain